MNFWKRYPADYQRKTARLTLAQHGAYSLLLDEIYTTEKPLPSDIEMLYRICRAMNRSEQTAVRVVADRFFPLGEDGNRHNKRASEELEEAAPAVHAARLNGAKGGRPKGSKKNPAGIPVGSQNKTQTEPSSKPPHSSDLREEEKPPAGVQGEKAPKATKRCPDSFVVTAELVAWAKQHAPGVDIPRETVKLRNHEFAKAKSDWPATWRNWLLEAFERLRGRRGNGAATDTGFGFETPADRAKRERIHELTGGLASRKPTAPAATEKETIDVAARLVG